MSYLFFGVLLTFWLQALYFEQWWQKAGQTHIYSCHCYWIHSHPYSGHAPWCPSGTGGR